MQPVAEAISGARALGADLVIFSIHWGPNMAERPSQLFSQFARKVIDLGADVYHGHSSHIFQGVEIYKSKPIIYDAGDFVDDYRVDPELRNDLGLLFRLQAVGGVVERVELVPTFISNCQVNLAKEPERETIIGRITSLSAEMGTSIQKGGDYPLIECKRTSSQASSAVRTQ